MKTVTALKFRCLTLLSACISLTSSLIPQRFLPPLPFEHTQLIYPGMSTFFNALVLFNLILGLSTVLGFCMFWRWSRPTAVISYIMTFLSYSMSAFFVDAGIKVAFDSLSIFLGGIVLSMAYYSPIAERFK